MWGRAPCLPPVLAVVAKQRARDVRVAVKSSTLSSSQCQRVTGRAPRGKW